MRAGGGASRDIADLSLGKRRLAAFGVGDDQEGFKLFLI
jgi:hypothetical protein